MTGRSSAVMSSVSLSKVFKHTTLSPHNPQGNGHVEHAVRACDAAEKSKQVFYYNRHHSAKQLTPLQQGDHVLTRLDNQKTWATVAVVAGENTTQTLPHRDRARSSVQAKPSSSPSCAHRGPSESQHKPRKSPIIH